MTTLSDLMTEAALRLRDTGNAQISSNELTSLINQGIDAVAAFYPREIQQTVGTVAAGVSTYSLGSMTRPYRLAIYSSDGTTYLGDIPHNIGDEDSGWEVLGGILYMPARWTYPAGSILKARGYGAYVQLSASSSTTDLDTSAINAVLCFVEAEVFYRLLNDRVLYQQWQMTPGNTDVTAASLNSIAYSARARWREEQRRLRKVRR